MKKTKILKFAYSVVSICFLFLVASCSKEVLDSGSSNDIEPNSEFAHTVSIDEAEEQLLEILNDLKNKSQIDKCVEAIINLTRLW